MRGSLHIDKARRPAYLSRMRKLARIFALAVLALYAAMAVVQPVRAGAMSLDMALAMAGMAEIPDCGGCPGEDGTGARACGLACTPPLVAMIGDAAAPGFAIRSAPERPTGRVLPAGRTDPPDPLPPRKFV